MSQIASQNPWLIFNHYLNFLIQQRTQIPSLIIILTNMVRAEIHDRKVELVALMDDAYFRDDTRRHCWIICLPHQMIKIVIGWPLFKRYSRNRRNQHGLRKVLRILKCLQNCMASLRHPVASRSRTYCVGCIRVTLLGVCLNPRCFRYIDDRKTTLIFTQRSSSPISFITHNTTYENTTFLNVSSSFHK